MNSRITPKDEEVTFSDDEFIVSKTCPKGRITYINRSFMRTSGYREDQLLSRAHNIIRHPDMPRGVFRLLWQTLQNGEEFFGYVKNLCADGKYYWVFANVTPDLDEYGKLKGYYSVRRKPNRAGVERIIPIYKEMMSIEKGHSSAEAPDASIQYLTDLVAQNNQSYPQFVLALFDVK